MNEPTIKTEIFFKTACCFEGALVLVAMLLGWIADINPFEFIIFNEQAIINGIIGALPLCLIFMALNQLQLSSLQKIKQTLHATLGPCLHKRHWTDLFILAAIAGIAEEILFRGVIQPWIENSWGMAVGLVISSVVFGLVHAITALYFAMAMAVSIYLGLYLDYAGTRNLLTPIIIHGLYDFFAFIVILRSYRIVLQKDR